jgi:N-acetylmuramoyl-L-alanine amidase
MLACVAMLLPACSILRHESSDLPGVRVALLPPNVHGRLVSRTMQPRYITIHSTANLNVTAARHADYLLVHGNRSQKNARLGRSGWVTWHFTVDDRGVVQHLLPTEQGDHADYGGPGDRQSIGVEICEFRNRARQSAAIDRAAHLTAALANRYDIPTARIVPHKHWRRVDFKYGKPCPRILLERYRRAPGGWRLGSRWERFVARVEQHRRRSEEPRRHAWRWDHTRFSRIAMPLHALASEMAYPGVPSAGQEFAAEHSLHRIRHVDRGRACLTPRRSRRTFPFEEKGL